MDEACRQLLTLAGTDTKAASPPAQVGADIPSFLVEIATNTGETRTFKIPYRRHQGSALESTDINEIIKQLERLSPSSR